jgi:hypothetical protein
MEFRGTKGEWITEIYTSENGRETTIVCNTDYNSDRTDIHIRFSAIDETEKETNRANALLIRKSPEMLEFLIELYNDRESYSGMFPSQQLKLEQLIKEATEL